VARKLQNRCKFCKNRRKLHCLPLDKFVGPEQEVFDCPNFAQRDMGKPLAEKKKGSLGGG